MRFARRRRWWWLILLYLLVSQLIVKYYFMKKALLFSGLFFILASFCHGQYSKSNTTISAGLNFSRYLGKGEGDNYFNFSKPGFQIELSGRIRPGLEWIMYGVAHFSTFNWVGKNKVPVEFWIPYYTEFLYYQKEKKNPLFIFFGYDYVRMKFPDMEKPDSHHNISLGAGWNLKLSNRVFLQFKEKPYIVLGNSIGQKFGFNSLINLHLSLTKITAE
jgi:hypothetical protein